MNRIKSEILETIQSADKFSFVFSVSIWLIILSIVCFVINDFSWAFGFGGAGLLSSIVTLVLAIKGDK